MFGYVTIYQKDLAPALTDRYQAYYCGLCKTLGKAYGATGQLTLSYDMTFMALLHAALYEPETRLYTGRCALHPLKQNPRAANDCLGYAADMSIALAYYNYLDDWQDDHNYLKRRQAKQLEPFLAEIEARHPGPCAAIKSHLAELTALENANCTDLDALCKSFGALLGGVFCWKEDLWAPLLLQMGRGLGGFIYLMDAYDDVEKDARRGSFNALAALAAALPYEEYEARCHQLLTQQLGGCAQAFTMLPILKETPEGQLLYSTLYSGVWCRYTLIKARHDAKHRGGKKEDG
ncbi:MAG: DUF5685 family protein [Gemmiger sp.]|nr:DUF5685 family protein [Gemmiger sp.]